MSRLKVKKNSIQHRVSSILLFCCLLCSCGIETPQTELQLKVDDAKLIEILTEIHLVESAYRMSEIKRDTFLKYSAEEMYEVIYEKNQITKSDFIETMEYYTFYPEKFKKIYEQVEQKIEKL